MLQYTGLFVNPSITDKPQKYTALQEDLVIIRQVEMVCITQPVLPTMGNIPKKQDTNVKHCPIYCNAESSNT